MGQQIHKNGIQTFRTSDFLAGHTEMRVNQRRTSDGKASIFHARHPSVQRSHCCQMRDKTQAICVGSYSVAFVPFLIMCVPVAIDHSRNDRQ